MTYVPAGIVASALDDTLSADAAISDYKIYVHSVLFSQQDAAALLAAMWKTDQRREATGSVR